MPSLPLTEKLKRAILLAKVNGRKLSRVPTSHSWRGKRAKDEVGGTTIDHLVSRGLARYSFWHEGGTPTEVLLTEEGATLGNTEEP